MEERKEMRRVEVDEGMEEGRCWKEDQKRCRKIRDIIENNSHKYKSLLLGIFIFDFFYNVCIRYLLGFT